jgi:hypothetical protein
VFDDFFDDLLADVTMGHLSATEQATDQHLVTSLEELPRMLNFGQQVVVARARSDTKFLDLNLVLLASASLLLLLFLVLELAEVHDAAHGRPLIWGNLYEVKVLLNGYSKSVGCLHDA